MSALKSRTARRRHHKRLARLARITPEQRPSMGIQLLTAWRQEAYRRAANLDAPEVWDLANEANFAIVQQIDPSGELWQELNRICAEAVAGASPGRLLGSKPKHKQLRERPPLQPVAGTMASSKQGAMPKLVSSNPLQERNCQEA